MVFYYMVFYYIILYNSGYIGYIGYQFFKILVDIDQRHLYGCFGEGGVYVIVTTITFSVVALGQSSLATLGFVSYI